MCKRAFYSQWIKVAYPVDYSKSSSSLNEKFGVVMSYEVMVFSENLSSLGRRVIDHFKADHVSSMGEVAPKMENKTYRAFVFDAVQGQSSSLEQCQALMEEGLLKGTPLILISASSDVTDIQKAFDLGCDDLIESTTSEDETCTRITKSIFNHIASSQLNQRLVQATETAKTALVDNSDLGANIQFLLKVHACDNLDQLGQQFFNTIQRYGLSCSLQMRAEMGVKNMEANGMAKELESRLLLQLKDDGRYVDFGRRSIINYDRVSLLIKNMPMDDPDKYGAIKDNTFCLAQGINSRIISLEDRHKLTLEKDSLRKLSTDVKDVIGALKNSYQEVMRKIVNEVENASESIQARMPSLALMEADEEFIEGVTEELLMATNRVFNDGLRVDELFNKLEMAVQNSLDSAQAPSEVSEIAPLEEGACDDDVELF